MDADCLIKITRAGYKEHRVAHFDLAVSDAVLVEVVEQAGNRPEKEIVRDNVSASRIRIIQLKAGRGDEALLGSIQDGPFGGRHGWQTPHKTGDNLGHAMRIVPGLLIYDLVRRGKIMRS